MYQGTQCGQDRPGLSSPKVYSQGLKEFWDFERMPSIPSFHPVLRGAGH